jgi:hypothetical protein
MRAIMNFKNLTYAKLNLNFDKELFANEYDEKILPNGVFTGNGLMSVKQTTNLNSIWKMVPNEEYGKISGYVQIGDATTYKFFKNERPSWKMEQLMHLDITNITDPLLIKFGKHGRGPSIRNETLDPKFHWSIKPEYADLEIVKWIHKNLPFEKIYGMHCVSIESGGFASIHRDSKGLYSGGSSAGENKLYKNGFVIITLNISDGGVPLYWSLDGEDSNHYYLSNDLVYLTNDYFLHGVPIVTSRRRQVRVTGIPNSAMWDLFVPETTMSIPEDYKYQLGNTKI